MMGENYVCNRKIILSRLPPLLPLNNFFRKLYFFLLLCKYVCHLLVDDDALGFSLFFVEYYSSVSV